MPRLSIDTTTESDIYAVIDLFAEGQHGNYGYSVWVGESMDGKPRLRAKVTHKETGKSRVEEMNMGQLLLDWIGFMAVFLELTDPDSELGNAASGV